MSGQPYQLYQGETQFKKKRKKKEVFSDSQFKNTQHLITQQLKMYIVKMITSLDHK